MGAELGSLEKIFLEKAGTEPTVFHDRLMTEAQQFLACPSTHPGGGGSLAEVSHRQSECRLGDSDVTDTFLLCVKGHWVGLFL